ncbi:hypothetical protein [Colwellia sp. E150_009]|jgi:hypothetical protein
MTKVFLLPVPHGKNNKRVLEKITRASSVSPLLLVFPKNATAVNTVDNPPPEPPKAA